MYLVLHVTLPMQKVLKIIVVTILLACTTTVYAKKTAVKNTTAKKTVTVCINQFIPHPSLNAVLWGFKEYLTESGITIKYKEYDAKGKTAIAAQIAGAPIGAQSIVLKVAALRVPGHRPVQPDAGAILDLLLG